MTPIQLFTRGILSSGRQPSLPSDTTESTLIHDSGIDVPAILLPLSQQDEAQLHSTINPLSESTNYAIELYERTKTIIDDCLS